MARTFTLQELRTKLRSRTDIVSDTHLSDDELNEFITSAAADTWDVIISSGLAGEQYVKQVSFSSVANQLEYSLATVCPDGDFYKIHQLYVDEGSGQLRPVPRINPAEIQSFRPPQSAITLKLYYIPAAPTFKTAGVFDNNATFDGINGWEEHTLATAEFNIRKKRDEDYTGALRRKNEMEARIQSMASAGWDEPPRVVRRRHRSNDPFMLFRNNINAYGIRSGKLELYYHYGYVP